MLRPWLTFAPCLILAACGDGGGGAVTEPSPFGPTGIPPELRRGGAEGAVAVVPGGKVVEGLEDSAGLVMDEDDILYTDPDAEDPGNVLPELTELLSAAPQEGPWKESYTNAFKEARQTGKPVLMWFTDSQNSPNCKMLNEELFNRLEFEAWAAENLVRLRIDQRISGNRTDHNTSRKIEYVKELKKRYKVLGQPTLVMMTPAGDVISKYKGFQRGQGEFKWGQLRQGAKLAGQRHQEWIKKMEKKGYRMWSDPRGRELFAKLVAYRDGELILIEPDGTRARTKERNLSVEDQDWIAAQKKARGIE